MSNPLRPADEFDAPTTKVAHASTLGENPSTLNELIARLDVKSATFEQIDAWVDALREGFGLGGRRVAYNAICTKYREAGDGDNPILTRIKTEWEAKGKMAQWGARH